MIQTVKSKSIIFLFLVLTILSSISTVAFVTGNVNTVFAKDSSGGGNSTDGEGGGGGSSSGGDGSSNTPPSTETTPSTAAPPTTTTPPATPPPGSCEPVACPPTTTPPPAANQTAADAARQAGLPPPVDCTLTPCNTGPAAPPTTTTPPPPATNQTAADAARQAGGQPGGVAECIAAPCNMAGVPTPVGNQTVAPQTLNQQTCPPLPIDANGRCPGIDARGGGLGLPPLSPQAQVKEISLLPDGSCNGAYDPSSKSSST